jgi:hypothetical protein
MKRSVVFFLFLVLAASPCAAETTKGGYYACTSEDAFKEIVQAAVRKDERGVQYLLENGCIITKQGIQISVIDRSWGTAKVRAYAPSGQAIMLWTNTENIQR